MTFDIYHDLSWRGLIKQSTSPDLERYLKNNKVTVYAGIDPTADALHLGHLVPLMTLKRLQMTGHRVIAVAGGATGLVGDPGGKSSERTILSKETLKQNLVGITKGIRRFLELEGTNPALILNNGDWFEGVLFLDFLRDVGKHFSVNYMITKDSVKTRLEDREEGISYTEFSYMLLQAYDFYHLHKKQGCTLQIGGSEQWGNITAGCELIRRMAAVHNEKAPQVFGLTFPLITKADGTKFGKTESGTVWLDKDRTSPYEFHQFLLRTSDTEVMTLLKFFTFLGEEEIKNLEKSLKNFPEKREAQKMLADSLTQMVHGEGETQKAGSAAKALFGAEVKKLNSQQILELFSGAPKTQKDLSALKAGIPLVDLLVESGLSSSKGAAKKDVSGGGIYLNNQRCEDASLTVKTSDLIENRFLILRKGKKTHHLISFS